MLFGPKSVDLQHGRFWNMPKKRNRRFWVHAEIDNFGNRLGGAGPALRAAQAQGRPGAALGAARHLRAGSQNCRFPHGPKMVDFMFWICSKVDDGVNRPFWDLPVITIKMVSDRSSRAELDRSSQNFNARLFWFEKMWKTDNMVEQKCRFTWNITFEKLHGPYPKWKMVYPI